MKLKILTTGGTIDKIYFDARSTFQVGDPQIGEFLKEADVAFEYEVQSLLHKDSLDMTDEDRRLIYDTIDQDPAHTRFLVTHGTDTMIATARLLEGIRGKTIVLTGSLRPARFRVSDAPFNIGFATAAAQLLPPGAYIAMNGCVFRPQQVRKNLEANRFEPLGNGG